MEPQPLPPQNPTKRNYFLIALPFVFLLIAATAFYFFFLKKDVPKQVSQEKVASTSAETKEEEKFTVGYVTAAEGLNLRDKPTLEGLIVLLLPYGTQVKIISTQGDWYFVEAQTRGFVSKEFIASERTTTVLKTFTDEESPFNFLYPDVYTANLKKVNNTYEYNFTGNDSYGGFKVEKEEGFTTIGNYALQNYPQATKTACSVQFAASRKECEQLQTDQGTIYLLLIETTLYKISYLKTEGGLLTDINNLVFYSFFVK